MAFPYVTAELERVLGNKVESQEKDPGRASMLNNVTKMVLVVEYNGNKYYGFQLQAGLPTIQGEVEKALEKLTGEQVRVIAASRTDTGVHARGQVVCFRTQSILPPKTFISGLNYYLPRDIAVRAAYKADDSFNVRSHAVSREYSYYILNSPTRSPMLDDFSFLVTGEMDIAVMNQAAKALVGEHDFAPFASSLGVQIKNTRRRVYQANFERDGELVIFNMVANSFLPHQVRNTVGALIRVGLGRMTVEEFHSIMNEKKHGLAGPAAPACGLCLMKVNYRRHFEEEE
jgi:tRNA pseudouridine38-40 synthase